MDLISATIWNENFWLPKNVTWKGFSKIEDNGVRLPLLHDLLYVYPLAGVLYIARLIFEKYIAQPYGRSLGIRDMQSSNKRCIQQQQQPSRKKGNSIDVINDNQSNSTYKQQYPTNVIHRENSSSGHGDLSKTANENRKSSSQLSYHRVSPLAKFSESCWRFVFYLSVFIYGIIVLRNKSWVWDTRHCWLNHPNQQLTKDIFWYYMIELAFYWSLVFSQFIDVKRKDFWQMFLHHIATISLLSFSYIVNFVRVGSLVLVIHDCGDYWLESAKMAKYARAQRVCDTLFVIFALVWFVTRLCYFPYKVLYTTIYEEVEILGYFPAFYLFNGLLILLQCLHYFWFYLICQVAIGALKAGKVEKDQRSDSEDSDDETYTKSGSPLQQHHSSLTKIHNDNSSKKSSENTLLKTSNSMDGTKKKR